MLYQMNIVRTFHKYEFNFCMDPYYSPAFHNYKVNYKPWSWHRRLLKSEQQYDGDYKKDIE